MKTASLLLLVFFTLSACQNNNASQTAPTNNSPAELAQAVSFAFKKDVNSGLDKYWYQGKAELNRYDLQQFRYADVHPGEVVIVFVTEDFLTDKQVKNERYQSENSVPILKMNHISRFTTGLYDYSIMKSVFTPVETAKHPQTLKTTTSTQDWCGHTFMQFNYGDGQYKSTLLSYFESEADQIKAIPYAILEDELMNRIRMNPEGMPIGSLQMIPSASILRLLHLPAEAVQAEASMSAYAGSDFTGEGLKMYEVQFPKLKRTLQIVFQSEAPYLIEGWTDTYPGRGDSTLKKSIAKRTHTILEKYWQEHDLDDAPLRKAFGVEAFPF
ncbi:MAG TPA: hypothetical protein PKA00_08910 [Saprospiraceae bacterium]|nr:hypothetical protein [Saprospiraceae bacterium]HMQ83015.1 hypothetical protein [Saprospiraceae bacterium]